MAAVDLGPVEPRQPPLALGEEEAIRVEPGLLFAEVEVGAGPGALLGVACEGPAGDRDPGVLVVADPERADREALGQFGRPPRGLEGPAHRPQRAHPLDTG